MHGAGPVVARSWIASQGYGPTARRICGRVRVARCRCQLRSTRVRRVTTHNARTQRRHAGTPRPGQIRAFGDGETKTTPFPAGRPTKWNGGSNAPGSLASTDGPAWRVDSSIDRRLGYRRLVHPRSHWGKRCSDQGVRTPAAVSCLGWLRSTEPADQPRRCRTRETEHRDTGWRPHLNPSQQHRDARRPLVTPSGVDARWPHRRAL